MQPGKHSKGKHNGNAKALMMQLSSLLDHTSAPSSISQAGISTCSSVPAVAVVKTKQLPHNIGQVSIIEHPKMVHFESERLFFEFFSPFHQLFTQFSQALGSFLTPKTARPRRGHLFGHHRGLRHGAGALPLLELSEHLPRDHSDAGARPNGGWRMVVYMGH